ncbi:MAG TPA: PIG-L family deacetylase, partial [Myxococcaceae bacterium]|nr:PIG-L family deacetylase [Myxococcaceae bacterium]
MSAPGTMRAALRRLHRTALGHLGRPLGEEELRRGAMVFAPHPDDETLGCGGTILRKRRAGAEVRIAFLTDGAASHAHLVPREALRALREREALEAAGALGVEASRVCWLGFPDGEL